MTADHQGIPSDLPPNFSWLNDHLAGSGHPGFGHETLSARLTALREVGIGCVVSLAPLEREAVRAAGLAHVELSVPDMGVPPIGTLEKAVDAALSELEQGRRILVHCGAGYGRTGLFIACVLVAQGSDPQEAIDFVRRKRPGSIETETQEALVHTWAAERT